MSWKFIHNIPTLGINKKVKVEKGNIINLLIVGYINYGKSTLANVLCDTEFFEENERSIKNSKDFQENFFTWKGMKYRVVDTNRTKKEKIINLIQGINQVLFVTDGKFTKEEIEIFKLFKNAIFESGITKYITIVRNKFENFKSKSECEKDEEDLREKIKSIVESCGSIVYVDNPPTNIYDNDDNDIERIINRKRRDQSRSILLSYLEKEGKEKMKETESANKIFKKFRRYVKESKK